MLLRLLVSSGLIFSLAFWLPPPIAGLLGADT